MAVSGRRLSLGNTQSQPCSGWRDTDSLGFSVFAFRGSLVVSAFACVWGSKGDCVLRSEGAGAWPPPHHLWKQGSSSVVTTWRSQTSKTSRSEAKPILSHFSSPFLYTRASQSKLIMEATVCLLAAKPYWAVNKFWEKKSKEEFCITQGERCLCSVPACVNHQSLVEWRKDDVLVVKHQHCYITRAKTRPHWLLILLFTLWIDQLKTFHMMMVIFSDPFWSFNAEQFPNSVHIR